MNKVLTSVFVITGVCYPLVVYFGLTRFEPRFVAFFLVAVLVLRVFWGNELGSAYKKTIQSGFNITKYCYLTIILLVLALILYTFGSNQAGGLKLYPVIINFSLLLSFVLSLVYPPTVIERIARISEPELSSAGVQYTRKVTVIWCGFFFINGLVAIYTSVYASVATWALYNGLISYLLIGSLLGGEYLYRHWFLKKV